MMDELYFTKLRDRLEAAEIAREDVRDALQKVAAEITDGKFPTP